MERLGSVMQLKNVKKYTILVSGASGIVGYGILRALKERGDIFLIGTTIYPQSPANCFADVVEIVPQTNAPEYLSALKGLIARYSIDMIIPGIEADMSVWNQARGELESTGTFVLLNNPDLISMCLDKWKFYEKLVENNYPGRIETSIDSNDARFSLPFLLKPRCGFGGRGIVKIETREQFEQNRNKIGDYLMMQEYVGSDAEEYTVSAFFDCKSAIRAVMGLRRKLSGAGYTEMAEVVDTDKFMGDIKQLADIFKPVGPTNFQFRMGRNALKLLEINPRISSSTLIRAKFGYNESSMAVDYFLEKKEAAQPAIRRGHAMRYTEEYVFYDSTNI